MNTATRIGLSLQTALTYLFLLGWHSGCFRAACFAKVADVMFLVDASGSVGEDNFVKMKRFMQDVINYFDIGTKFTRVGVITFSTYARLEFGLGTYNSSTDLLDAVDQITYSQGGTDTGKSMA